MKTRITPFLWFDTEAEAAAKFYVSVFPNSKIKGISYYPGAGADQHGRPAGSVMTVSFELDGLNFTALNGGPSFKFDEAISMVVDCESQDEIDYYWDKLGEGGQYSHCGWLKDKFGLSWQIVPVGIMERLISPEREKCERMFAQVMEMDKLDMGRLQRAFDGE